MFGILNVNKPAGITSRAVVNRITRMIRPLKAGHAGTLDPLATGVLLVCVGGATRLVPYLQEQRKEYVAEFLLGQASDTDDIGGTVREVPNAPAVTRSAVELLLPRFVGQIEQVPPRYSAVKLGGQRAHVLARRGRAVDMPPRQVCVHRLELLSFEYPRFSLRIECGSGTYVRSIGRDLGSLLHTGTVMTSLVRTRIGRWTLESAVPLEDLNRRLLPLHLQPAAVAVADWPSYVLTLTEMHDLQHGRTIAVARALNAADGQCVALLSSAGVLLAIANCGTEGRTLQPRLVFAGAE